MAHRLILSGILLCFGMLSVLYSGATPYRSAGVYQRNIVQDIGAPDERQHANYVLHLVEGRGFPVFDAQDPSLYESYQSHQPPFYYLLASTVVKMSGTDLESPTGGFWPRLLSTVLGMGTILGVYFAAKWGLRRDDVPLAAASMCAFLPMFVALNSAVSNDPLLFLVCTWTLAICAINLHEGWNLSRSLLVGALVGLGLLTKTTALTLLPMVAVAMLLSRRTSFVNVKSWVALVLPLVLAAPWWIRNQSLYGDPFAMGAFREAFVNSAQASSFIEAFGTIGYWVDWVGWWTLRSFIGVFGYMDIFLPDTLYRLMLAALAVCALAWVVRRKRIAESQGESVPGASAFVLVSWTLFIVVLLLFIQFNITYFQAQARYLYPAVAPISIGIAACVCALFGRFSRWSWAVVSAILVSLNIYVLNTLPGEFEKRGASLESVRAERAFADSRTQGERNVQALGRVDWR